MTKKTNRVRVYRVMARTTNQRMILFEQHDENMLEYMRQLLREGAVEVDFIKENGVLRHARGTLCSTLLSENHALLAEHAMTRRHERVLTYYDLDCREWRSAAKERIIGFLETLNIEH